MCTLTNRARTTLPCATGRYATAIEIVGRERVHALSLNTTRTRRGICPRRNTGMRPYGKRSTGIQLLILSPNAKLL